MITPTVLVSPSHDRMKIPVLKVGGLVLMCTLKRRNCEIRNRILSRRTGFRLPPAATPSCGKCPGARGQVAVVVTWSSGSLTDQVLEPMIDNFAKYKKFVRMFLEY